MTKDGRAFERVTLIVLDSLGMGEMPDAAAWGDAGADTLGHICESRQVELPNLRAWGLGNVRPLSGVAPSERPRASYGRCALRSNGKDTTTGHWEMAGIILDQAFPTYPGGFPPEVIERFVAEARVPGVLGNYPASGTEIIKELGEEHVRTGKPIVYTSADSVFQIAAHEEVVPVPRLYEMCEAARRLLQGEHQVGRVIARPFVGEPGAFRRTENRHDYAVPPPRDMLLPTLSGAGLDVVAVGKISSIYDAAGVTQELPGKNNDQSIDQTIAALRGESRGLIFSNLVDFDMLYGHRRDAHGYRRALEKFDVGLVELESKLGIDDLVLMTADHGNDPTKHETTDHTREYVPILAAGRRVHGAALGTRESFADVGATVEEAFGLTPAGPGRSFLREAVAT